MAHKVEVTLLKEMLSIPSVNGSDNERTAAEYIYQYLISCNVWSELQQIDETHANVIAKIDGESKETVIWNGHLDTVPYGELKEWNTEPSIPVEKSGKIYARGASDMKSGLAAMVYTLGFMKQKGIVPAKSILFLATCDEENSGLGAHQIIVQKKMPKASLLLIGEPTGLRLGSAQKGCIWVRLSVYGKTSHGAYPKEGINAIEYGMSVCQELKEQLVEYEHQILGNATAQITKVKGGIAPNMTPDRAEFTMDIRMLPGMDSKKVEDILLSCCKKYIKLTHQKVDFDYKILNDRKAIEINRANSWLEVFGASLNKIGIEAEEIGINYFTDASVLTLEYEEIPVLLFGPGEPAMAHKPNEYVDIKTYLNYIEILMDIFGNKK